MNDINFTLEEIELLEKCLTKYLYFVGGSPSDVISCAEKLQKLKEQLVH